MCFFGGGGGDNGASAARAAENARQSRISQGMSDINDAFSPYNDAYYKNYEQQYVDQSRPDLDKQQKRANEDVLFGLARTGNTKASAAAKSYSDVVDQRAKTDLQVADQARGASADQRNQVEMTRSNLISQLNATANAGAAADAARNEAIVLNRTPTYSPLSNAFAEVTNQFALNEQARRGGAPGWGFGLTTTDPILGSRSSVQNVA